MFAGQRIRKLVVGTIVYNYQHEREEGMLLDMKSEIERRNGQPERTRFYAAVHIPAIGYVDDFTVYNKSTDRITELVGMLVLNARGQRMKS